MSLRPYAQKRSVKDSQEPPARLKSSTKSKSVKEFVVQKHAARHLHYDFRLEAAGVLKSWAVPKGIPEETHEKHLAVMVEDHPYEYRTFEGVIPKGNYGAGTVEIWDKGTYIPLNSNHEPCDDKEFLSDLNKGKISFIIQGKKLKGHYSLVRMKNTPKENQWLLIKADDVKENKPSQKISKTTMPHHIKPMLAYLAEKPFDNDDWLYEFKWDGFRAIAEVDGANVELYSRTFQSFNQRFAPICQALKTLKVKAVFDGEIVVIDDEGKLGFQPLQNYQRTGEGTLRYIIFDLIYYDGQDVRELPIQKRKELLQTLLPKGKGEVLQFSQHVIGSGHELYQIAQDEHYEGIMAKKLNSRYESVRSKQWLKIKIHARQEAIICGFTRPRGSRTNFGSLILGVYENDALTFVGHVGGGFDEIKLKEIYAKLLPLITEKCPFDIKPKTNTPATWVKPKLICEVSFAEWTDDGQMRQPIFIGLRDDKKALDVHKEVVSKSIISPRGPKNMPPLTNLDKVYWPTEGYTKGDLLNYYEAVSSYLLPHLKDRPLTLHRYPNGIEQADFYQKNMPDNTPEWIQTFAVKHTREDVNYLLIQDLKSLLYTINLGCIDLNPFSSRIKTLEYPDYMFLDLDPENTPFEAVIETALVLKEILDAIGATGFCKTSGGRGMHIYVPLKAKYTYEQTKQFSQLLTEAVRIRLPKLISIEHSPSKRQKKVYIDCLRNAFGQTVASVYSVRPRAGAMVSTPLDWNEVNSSLKPQEFTMGTVPQRLKEKGDLFKGVLGKGIDLLKCLDQLQQKNLIH